MIPQNKLSNMKKGFEQKETAKKTATGSNLPSLFFKALDEKESRQKYDVLVFSPLYVLRKYAEKFSDDAFMSISFPIDMHAFRLGSKFYSIPCKHQTVKFPFAEKYEEEECSICKKGLELKEKYWARLNPILKEYKAWAKIPTDIQKDLLAENQVWKNMVGKKTYDYLPIIPIKIEKDKVTLPKNLVWFKAPVDLLKQIKESITDGEYPFSEDYTKDGGFNTKTYAPKMFFKIIAERDKKNTSVYNYLVQPSPNTNEGYNLRFTDNGIEIANSMKSIEKTTIEITDLYAYFENQFEDWEEKTKVKEFEKDFSIENGIDNQMNTNDEDEIVSEETDDDVDIQEDKFDKF